MVQCLRITFCVPEQENLLQNLVQKHARRLDIEGSAQMIEPKKVQVLACGAQEAIEQLIDAIYKGCVCAQSEGVDVEPFIKDRDFRGVFRVIE